MSCVLIHLTGSLLPPIAVAITSNDVPVLLLNNLFSLQVNGDKNESYIMNGKQLYRVYMLSLIFFKRKATKFYFCNVNFTK